VLALDRILPGGLAPGPVDPYNGEKGPIAPSGSCIMSEKATFGAGCFWGIEAGFRRVPGVIDAAVGYEGGTLENPSYRHVCTDTTGHAEVVQVEYDPDKVSYGDLLDVFWKIHDPTTLDRQGPDVGTQYRSAIFFHNDVQRAQAEESLALQNSCGRFRRPIVTQIVPAGTFYRAEEYHQKYLEKRGQTSCAIH
jgi:peptide-methionine (S)-S-oxide reductase